MSHVFPDRDKQMVGKFMSDLNVDCNAELQHGRATHVGRLRPLAGQVVIPAPS